MTIHIPKQHRIKLKSARKTDLRSQFGALVYRVHNGKTQVLLITSRGTKRWIIPKGWPMSGMTAPQAAAQEAWEEGGVRGKPHDLPIGFYSYTKDIETRRAFQCGTTSYVEEPAAIARGMFPIALGNVKRH